MQRIIEEHIDKTVVDPDSFFSYVFQRVHAKNAAHVPYPVFLDTVKNLTDFPEIVHAAEHLEQEYTKIQNKFNDIL
jgi:hypothetical protein